MKHWNVRVLLPVADAPPGAFVSHVVEVLEGGQLFVLGAEAARFIGVTESNRTPAHLQTFELEDGIEVPRRYALNMQVIRRVDQGQHVRNSIRIGERVLLEFFEDAGEPDIDGSRVLRLKKGFGECR